LLTGIALLHFFTFRREFADIYQLLHIKARNCTLVYGKVDLTSIESMMTEEEKQKVNKFIGKQEKEIDKALGEGSGKAVNKLFLKAH
jgi:hypothetical protein